MTSAPELQREMQAAAPASQSEAQIGWGFLRSRRWIGYYALLLIFAVVCTFLGNWQFERRAEARAEISRIDTNYDAEPVPLTDLVNGLDDFDLDRHKWHPVTVTGEYFGETYLARGRPGPGGVGSDLISAFRTTDGQVLFVDRGWVGVNAEQVASGEVSISELPAPPEGNVTVEVRLRASEQQIPGRVTDGRTIGSIEAPELAKLLGAQGEAYTGLYGALISEQPAAEHGALADRPERSEGPHLSYALQWYIFIIIACIGAGYAAYREHRSLNVGSARIAERDRRREERRRRRGPTDADEEDALLEG